MPHGEMSAAVRTAAGLALDWLAETDPLPGRARAGDFVCDAIIGFGVFDRRLPRFCGEMYAQGIAPRIIFTGGVGAGSGDLEGPEADVWREELRQSHPAIPESDIILENRSTNTGENVRFTAALLALQSPGLAFGVGIKRVVIVASPSRMRRVQLTLRHLQPAVTVLRQVPPFSFAAESQLHARNGVDYVAHLCGELDRIVEYPRRGFIAAAVMPGGIVQAHAVLCRAVKSGHGGGFVP